MVTRKSTACLATGAALALALLVGGCRSRGGAFKACTDACGDDYYAQAATAIDYPAVSPCSMEACGPGIDAPPPRTLRDLGEATFRDVTLDDVIHQGLAQSEVLRELGGAVLRSPQTARTAWDPSTVETDPTYGLEAALSEFDAQLSSSLYFENNDRALNNEFFGGGTRLLQQNAGVHQIQLSKRAVTGTELAARQIVEMDGNNAPGNAFDNGWTVKEELEARHPLLQGSGMQFNRIAGPGNTPGVYNGVLIARLATDMQLTDFEMSVRDLVSNLENAYWDLYFAYRDLDSKLAARDAALDTWRRVRALYEAGRRGGEAEKEAQAREQYFRFQEEVETALAGRLIDGTRTGNGSQGGTFRAQPGVYVAERRLRRLMGLPLSDGDLLRPATEPVVAAVAFDWSQVTLEAVERRPELRRQKWQIRRRELELIASKNYLLPRLDAVGRYRWRGFGRDLIDQNGPEIDRFETAYGDLLGGDFQEWQLGVELDVPIGYRRAHAGVRNAELRLARERAVLCDQQQEVLHDVASSVAEVDRAYAAVQSSYNRLTAANQQLEAVRAAFEAEKAALDLLLDGQRRLAEAQSRHYQALAEYALAIKNTHFAKGTLLEFDGVYLTEGAWPKKAYCDAADLEALRGRPRKLNYASRRAPVVSHGAYDQHRDAATAAAGVLPDGQLFPVGSTPAPLASPSENGAPAEKPSPTEKPTPADSTAGPMVQPAAVGGPFAAPAAGPVGPPAEPSATPGLVTPASAEGPPAGPPAGRTQLLWPGALSL